MGTILLTALSGTPLNGRLVYRVSEYSFDFMASSRAKLNARAADGERSSLQIGTLQIEIVHATGIALFVWGLHPRVRWNDGHCEPEPAVPGLVRVVAAPPLVPASALSVARVGEWDTIYDSKSGWLRSAAAMATLDEQRVLIASGTIIGIRRERLNSLWLHPEIEH